MTGLLPLTIIIRKQLGYLIKYCIGRKRNSWQLLEHFNIVITADSSAITPATCIIYVIMTDLPGKPGMKGEYGRPIYSHVSVLLYGI